MKKYMLALSLVSFINAQEIYYTPEDCKLLQEHFKALYSFEENQLKNNICERIKNYITKLYQAKDLIIESPDTATQHNQEVTPEMLYYSKLNTALEKYYFPDNLFLTKTGLEFQLALLKEATHLPKNQNFSPVNTMFSPTTRTPMSNVLFSPSFAPVEIDYLTKLLLAELLLNNITTFENFINYLLLPNRSEEITVQKVVYAPTEDDIDNTTVKKVTIDISPAAQLLQFKKWYLNSTFLQEALEKAKENYSSNDSKIKNQLITLQNYLNDTSSADIKTGNFVGPKKCIELLAKNSLPLTRQINPNDWSEETLRKEEKDKIARRENMQKQRKKQAMEIEKEKQKTYSEYAKNWISIHPGQAIQIPKNIDPITPAQPAIQIEPTIENSEAAINERQKPSFLRKALPYTVPAAVLGAGIAAYKFNDGFACLVDENIIRAQQLASPLMQKVSQFAASQTSHAGSYFEKALQGAERFTRQATSEAGNYVKDLWNGVSARAFDFIKGR